jgi:O-acetyl-ADP-ribose deacetylase (regulator of RNase III)
MRITTKISAFAATLALVAAPAAIAGNHGVSKADARAIGKEQCQEYKENFKENRSDFGKCVSAAATTARNGTNPAKSCQGLSKKKTEGQEKTDFAACVKAAAQAEKEARKAARG